MEVPKPRSEEARLVRCPNCGGSRQGNRAECAFCGSLFSSVDEGWGLICPGCFCRLPNDAQFCVECGLRLLPQKLETISAQLMCPRCQGPLQGRQVAEAHVHECAGCGGLWLGAETFQLLCTNKELMASTSVLLDRSQPMRRFEPDASVVYMPCPTCRDLMARQNFARISGVLIDRCRDHGVWLDNQELNHILEFVQSGGIERAHEFEREERGEREIGFSLDGTRPASSGYESSYPPPSLDDEFAGAPRFLRALAAIVRCVLE